MKKMIFDLEKYSINMIFILEIEGICSCASHICEIFGNENDYHSASTPTIL